MSLVQRVHSPTSRTPVAYSGAMPFRAQTNASIPHAKFCKHSFLLPTMLARVFLRKHVCERDVPFLLHIQFTITKLKSHRLVFQAIQRSLRHCYINNLPVTKQFRRLPDYYEYNSIAALTFHRYSFYRMTMLLPKLVLNILILYFRSYEAKCLSLGVVSR